MRIPKGFTFRFRQSFSSQILDTDRTSVALLFSAGTVKDIPASFSKRAMLELSSDQSWAPINSHYTPLQRALEILQGTQAIIGGLTLSVPLTIFLIPAIFPWLVGKKYRPESMSALRWALPAEAPVDSAVTF